MQKNNRFSTALVLTESAVMIALAFILSMIKIVDLPYGGSITAFSMLPIILIAYRHGTGRGLLVGLAFSLLQLLLGLNSLSYATSSLAAVAIILLDYIMAYVVLGLGGVFRGKLSHQGSALAAGALMCCLLRYICHIISGCTVWAGVSIPTSDGLIYSIGYNATYMIPETLLTVVAAYFAGSVFTLTEKKITRRRTQSGSFAGVLTAIPVSLAVTICCAFLFGMMQNPDDGSFDITLVTTASLSAWIPIIVTAATGLVGTLILAIVAKKKKQLNA